MADLTEWLSTLRPGELTDILTVRADALGPPAPRSLRELAQRLDHSHSVARAVFGLPLPVVQVAEAVQALGEGCTVEQLAAALGCATDDTELHHALTALRLHALVWSDGPVLHTQVLGRVWPYPLGIGATAGDLLEDRRITELKEIAVTLGIEPASRRSDLVRDIAAQLADAETVRRLAADAPDAVQELLRQAAWHGPYVEADECEPVHWAIQRGLLVGGYWDSVLQMPAEVILALRGPDYRFPFDPAPARMKLVELTAKAVEQEASAAATAAVARVAALLRQCARQPVAVLKAGGVGAREIRRLAKSIGDTEPHTRFWLELCRAAELVAVTGRGVRTTTGYDTWRTAEPAEQLTTLLDAWRELHTAPLYESGRAALTWSPDGTLVADLRQRVLLTAELLPAGRGAARADDVVALTAWRYPMLVAAAEDGRAWCQALWREAELLGVVARGAVTRLGRAWTGEDAEALAEAAYHLVPGAETVARFQADLTAVVAGTPSADLAELLDSAADREAGDTAAVWRFAPDSVRRALDAGTTAEHLLDALRAVAADGILPQPLEYLVGDVARRHGAIRVRQVACCLRADDPALLDEIQATRSLATLRLTRLAPTVLASDQPVAETLEALRTAGYAPVCETPQPAPVIERVPRVPARRARPQDSVPPDPAEVAAALLAAGAGEPEEPEEPTRDGDAFGEIAHIAGQLTATEQRLLGYAVREGVPVRIGYTDATGSHTNRVIEDAALDGHVVLAWCTLRQAERAFALPRITSVSPA